MQNGCSGDNKERKKELEKSCEIKCGFCKYNQGENSNRKPKPDKYKNINKNSIRDRESIFNDPDFVSIDYEDDDIWSR